MVERLVVACSAESVPLSVPRSIRAEAEVNRTSPASVDLCHVTSEHLIF